MLSRFSLTCGNSSGGASFTPFSAPSKFLCSIISSFKKLSCTQNWNTFIIPGVTIITRTNSNLGYYSTPESMYSPILLRPSASKNMAPTKIDFIMIVITFHTNSCSPHAFKSIFEVSPIV